MAGTGSASRKTGATTAGVRKRKTVPSTGPQKAHFTHFDAAGQAHMVDVAAKDVTKRVAVAGGRIVMQPATLALIVAGTAKKGDVLGVARIAAIQAAKRTADLIPLCHPLAADAGGGRVHARRGRQRDRDRRDRGDARPDRRRDGGADRGGGGPADVYDMCKAADRGMRIEGLRLLEKSGGKSGHFKAP